MRKAPTANSPAVPPESAPNSIKQTYADAKRAETDYPASRLPPPRTGDRLTAEGHWRDICSELTSQDNLAQPFGE